MIVNSTGAEVLGTKLTDYMPGCQYGLRIL